MSDALINLDDFLSTTCIKIIDGVKKAQTYAAEQGARIDPSVIQRGSVTTNTVEFNVGLTVMTSDSTKAGAGLAVGIIAVGGQGQSDTSEQCQHSVRFNVPLCLPTQPEQSD